MLYTALYRQVPTPQEQLADGLGCWWVLSWERRCGTGMKTVSPTGAGPQSPERRLLPAGRREVVI